MIMFGSSHSLVCTFLTKVISRLENILINIDDSDGWKRIKIIPLSLSSSSKLLKTLKPIKIDTIWTGLSVSHYIDHSFSQIVSNGGLLIVETPLFLLLVSKELLEAFKEKVKEIGHVVGFKCIESDYDVMKTYSVSLNKV